MTPANASKSVHSHRGQFNPHEAMQPMDNAKMACHRVMVIAVALFFLLLTGCGTYYSQRDYWINPGEDEGIVVLDGIWVYGGAINDINLVLQLYGLTLIDLPFSFVADTVLLPMTVFQQICGRPEKHATESPGGEVSRQGQ